MTNIVFDLGAVLIGWEPEQAFTGHFPDPAMIAPWLSRIDFHGWNRLQDGGRSMADAVAQAEADHGADAAPLADYLANFGRTITQPVAGSWEIVEALDAAGHPLFAITNWSAETFPAAIALYPRLGTAFRDIVVSGAEKMLKPEAAIYRLLLERNGLRAGESLFIDDSIANVEGARAVGMDAVHFTDAAQLARDLKDRGLL